MTDPDEDDDTPRAILERFVLDNPDLERLEAIVDTFNPFVAMRWTRQETRHSVFLAWLFNPRETHGLGAYCLRTFLKRVARYAADPAQTPTVIDVDSWDLDRAAISTEWRNIDLFVQDDANSFVAVFENKIDSGEHSEQLRRYRSDVEAQFPNHRKLFSYLTIEGDPASEHGYIPISYAEIAQFLDDTLERRGDQIGPDVRAFIGHYAEMVRREIVEDSEIQRLCRTIYEKHQKALDLIFEHRPDKTAHLSEALRRIVSSHPSLEPDHSSKSYVRFIPKSWDTLPRVGEGWTPTKRLLLFELDLAKGGIGLKLVLGPGEAVQRERLQSVLSARPEVFNKASTRVYPKWWSCHIERWITSKQLEEVDPTELESLLRQRFDQFVKDRLPIMESSVLASAP